MVRACKVAIRTVGAAACKAVHNISSRKEPITMTTALPSFCCITCQARAPHLQLDCCMSAGSQWCWRAAAKARVML